MLDDGGAVIYGGVSVYILAIAISGAMRGGHTNRMHVLWRSQRRSLPDGLQRNSTLYGVPLVTKLGRSSDDVCFDHSLCKV